MVILTRLNADKLVEQPYYLCNFHVRNSFYKRDKYLRIRHIHFMDTVSGQLMLKVFELL